MLRKISEKRKAKGEHLCWNSTIKAKAYTLKKSPIKKISNKARKLWEETRKEVFQIYGKKCILCGSEECIEVHHFDQTRSQNPARKYDTTNLVPLCKKCHNHNGVDERFYALREIIIAKLKELKI